MEKTLNSIRVAYENWYSEERFDSLLKLLGDYDCGISQVSLFTSCTHSPLTLQTLAERAGVMKKRMKTLRAAGFSAGINHLPTIGHHSEDIPNSLCGPYTHMTGIGGDTCDGSYCMNDRRFLEEYIVPSYRLLANAEPDYIWIDDDVRYGHMPVGNGCFCDGCIALFNSETGSTYTRESLRAALNSGDIPLRNAWLKHNGDAVCRLFTLIGRTVREISPSITLGFMTGERYFEGYDFASFAAALSENGRYELMWRPGGGAYTDRSPDDFIAKAQEIARQNAFLPSYVKSIQSEIENFPYQLIKKSPRSTALEAAIYMTSGCTGAAFNILPSETGEDIGNIAPHLKAIAEMTPFYRLLNEKLTALKPRGIYSGWKINSQAALPEGEWTSMSGGMYAGYSRELFTFGLPEGYTAENASVTTLTGREATVMNDAELEVLLSGGVCLDAGAVDYLDKRGFGSLTGFSVWKKVPVDARELYTAHPINDGIENRIRNCRQAFNYGESVGLVPLSEECKTLSTLIDYHGKTLADCACGIYRNRLGGRICAAGYYPFSWISDYSKTKQLRRLFIYLSDGALPSYVENYTRLRNVTLTGDGRTAVTLLNTNIDELSDISLCVKTDKTSGTLYDMRCNEVKIFAQDAENGYKRFTIKNILPCEMAVIEL